MEIINVKFYDANKYLAICKVEIKNGNISFTGEYNNGIGQVNNSIKPRTKLQKKFLELWDKYHLNGLSAGTPRQNEALKKLNINDAYQYKIACSYLNSIGLLYDDISDYDNLIFTKIIKDGNKKLYKYGNGWVKLKITDDILNEIRKVCELLNNETKRYLENIKSRNNDENVTFDNIAKEDEKKAALGLALDLSPEECNFSIKKLLNTDIYSYAGINYYVLTEEEAKEKAKERIEDCLNESLADVNPILRYYFDEERYIDDVISNDGIGSILNVYDGSELEAEVNDTIYYIYRI